MKISRVFIIVFLSAGLLRAEEGGEGGPAAKTSTTAAAKVNPAALPGMQPVAAETAATVPAAAAPAETDAVVPFEAPSDEPAASPGAHTVKKGDTLWDLAAEYYRQPFDWKVIWEANKGTIHNPNLIYPRQQFRIPGRTGAEPAAAEEPAAPVETAPVEEVSAPTAEEPPAEPSEPTEEAAEPAAEPMPKKPSKLGGAQNDPNTFLVDKNWKGDGRIISDMDKKILISQNDVVYLNIGTKAGVKPRMRADVYRRSQNVREPGSGKNIGSVVRRVAVIEMTQDVGPATSSAVVIISYEPVKIGDMVRLKN